MEKLVFFPEPLRPYPNEDPNLKNIIIIRSKDPKFHFRKSDRNGNIPVSPRWRPGVDSLGVDRAQPGCAICRRHGGRWRPAARQRRTSGGTYPSCGSCKASSCHPTSASRPTLGPPARDLVCMLVMTGACLAQVLVRAGVPLHPRAARAGGRRLRLGQGQRVLGGLLCE